jgi:cytochrome c oxidase subunit 2
VFLDAGCGRCHTVRGTEAAGRGGPDLTHLASRQTIVSGLLANDAASLERWITQPHTVKNGTAMPVTDLDPDSVGRLVELLGSLR